MLLKLYNKTRDFLLWHSATDSQETLDSTESSCSCAQRLWSIDGSQDRWCLDRSTRPVLGTGTDPYGPCCLRKDQGLPSVIAGTPRTDSPSGRTASYLHPPTVRFIHESPRFRRLNPNYSPRPCIYSASHAAVGNQPYQLSEPMSRKPSATNDLIMILQKWSDFFFRSSRNLPQSQPRSRYLALGLIDRGDKTWQN